MRIAQAADQAGWEFLLPLGRWRGFGGKINFNDKTFEVFTWAAGIGAVTSQIQVLTTAHTRIFHPVLAAKQGCTVDHISGGRSALNVVAGQKEAEVAMFGVAQLEHDESYEEADEWLTIVKRAWTEEEDFDFEGKYFRLSRVHLMPKPIQKPYPLVVNAGQSPIGRRFGAKHADFSFQVLQDLDSFRELVADSRELAWREYRRELGVIAHAYVVCRDTEKEALDYIKYYVDERGDWEAAEGLIDALIAGKEQSLPVEQLRQLQRAFISGWAGYPLVGTPEQIVEKIEKLSEIGVDGAALHWVDFEAGIAQFNEKVLPLMIQAGLRKR